MKYKEYLTEARKMDNEELSEMADEQGLGYTIQQTNWKFIEDKELAKWWKNANDAMAKIESILGR